jgi:hypothetical protein
MSFVVRCIGCCDDLYAVRNPLSSSSRNQIQQNRGGDDRYKEKSSPDLSILRSASIR